MRFVLLLSFVCLVVAQGENPANWTADFAPCDRHSELLRQGHMELGVKLATGNIVLAQQFRRALDSWARIVDLGWHEDETLTCSMELADGDRALFDPSAVSARSQLPDRLNFQGWIAFNPRQDLDETELYRISLHEIGHMLGLNHSLNVNSVMYSYSLDGQEWLDAEDLATLATHHKLRIATNRAVRLTVHQPSVTIASGGQ